MRFFDLHCDTATECYAQKVKLKENQLQLSLDKANRLEKWVQVYAIWLDDSLRGEKAYQHFCRVHEYFDKELKENAALVVRCTNNKALDQAIKEGKYAAFLSVEGSAALGGKLNRVEEFYNKGIRLMTLTWNESCEVGDGCMVKNAGGLTAFGIKVVKQMNKLGMVIDVSHLSEKGFWDVAKVSKRPFVATHSNSFSVSPHPRNLKDEQFKAILASGGIVGMNFYPMFINATLEASIDELLFHIDHFLDLGGEKCIALGSDFDGAKMPYDLKDISQIDKLYEKLVGRYGTTIAEDIFYNNGYEFFKKNFRNE